MNPTKTGLYTTNADGRSILLYWDGEDWVNADGLRSRFKTVQWSRGPWFVPALRTWVGLTEERKLYLAKYWFSAEHDINRAMMLLNQYEEEKKNAN